MRIAKQQTRQKRQSGRAGFTLLEVLLAAAIGVLLMTALYVAMQVQLDHAQAGREAVEQSLLARALLRRMSNDITPSLGAPLPSNTASGANMASGGNSGAAGGASSAAGSSGASTTPASSSNSATSSTSSTAPVLNLQGDSGRLVLWVSRISSDLSPTSTNPFVSSDLHRITYWLAGGGSPVGLARQEIKQATSDDAQLSTPPDIPDEDTYVIAEEVQSVAFRYFDGSAWQDSWDGTQADPSSGASMGPPQAVEITLTIQTPSSDSTVPNNSIVKTYRHVVAIPTANGTSPAPTTSNSQ
jgi:prepilin-type N-terminal cleavage/methylation domain-containing protein